MRLRGKLTIAVPCSVLAYGLLTGWSFGTLVKVWLALVLLSIVFMTATMDKE